MESNQKPAEQQSSGHINVRLPTLGGRQFWADELFFHDWHIQRNVFTGHCRLLDGSNVRHAWGSFDQCAARLEKIKRERNLPPMRGPAVVVLHGLFRTPMAMRRMTRFLRDQGNYSVFNVAYPTTRGSIASHAAGLAKVVRSLEGIDQVNFVAHSLGNLVIRHYLADCITAANGTKRDARIKRFVMLAPPNQGAQLAVALSSVRMFHWVAGASAGQLAREWEQLALNLATPDCEFGILAGGRGTLKGYNPWFGEDNDMVVSVESTRLAGAADFAVLKIIHTLMMDDATAQQYTLRFLQHGYFISENQRNPLASEPRGS
jgi:pimeloyl-ACP methyl ester carboxylesterase